ncbi:MAG: hypothetical protein KTR32_25965 [Granulosicoccus sp.]|nr:hypothetical protein [Granulosicoccus sp.]
MRKWCSLVGASGTSRTLRCIVALLFITAAVVGINQPVMANTKLRVMVVFDSTGHRIGRLYHPADSTRSVPRSIDGARVKKEGRRSSRLPVIYWYGADGSLLAESNIVDPRVRHVPLTGTASSQSPVRYAVQESGVYLITGPASTARILVALPPLDTTDISVPAQQWMLDLTQIP